MLQAESTHASGENMRIGVMLRHYEQQEGGVKHYTKALLPLLFSLGSHHQYSLIYQNPKLLGTYAGYPNVEEFVNRMPGTVLWDQIAVPWITRNKKLDIIFNPKFTIPFFYPRQDNFCTPRLRVVRHSRRLQMVRSIVL
jgi:hypothetical protein